MTPTRARALDAAIDLVGTRGLRALTHAGIDDHAGLPRGSTSNYFRTRLSLLSGVVDRLVELELLAVDATFSPASTDEFVDALCALLASMTRDNRTQTTARLVLFLEASHHADLRDALSRGRTAMETTAVLALARLGARDPLTAAGAVAACFEGLLLHSIARHEESDPRMIFDLVVKAALD